MKFTLAALATLNQVRNYPKIKTFETKFSFNKLEFEKA